MDPAKPFEEWTVELHVGPLCVVTMWQRDIEEEA